MVVMESQGDKEKRETLVLRDHLAHKVRTLTCTCTQPATQVFVAYFNPCRDVSQAVVICTVVGN